MKLSLLPKMKYTLRGFTLVEVMVAVSIFAIVVTIGISSLLTANTALVRSQAQRKAIDSVSFVLESMARQIRVGEAYKAGNNEFEFITADGDEKTFFQDVHNNSTVRGIFQKIDNNDPVAMTSTGVNVTNLDFHLSGTNSGGPDGLQPIVQIVIGGETLGRQPTEFRVQTSVTRRILDFE